MARINTAGYDARDGVNAVRHSSALAKLTRVGFACKGLVYFLIGILALMAAFGNGGETTDQKGILNRVAEQPFGEFALAIIGVGLLAYAAWRFCSAVYDTEGEGASGKGMAKRVGYAISGVIYTSIAFYALRMVIGDGGGSGSTGVSLTARLMNAPAGTLLVVAVGIAVMIAGVMQFRDAVQGKFMKKMRTNEMSQHERDAAQKAGKWGYAARGVVFAIMGSFFVLAAMRHNPGEVRGIEGALDTLASQSFGPWLLAAVAIGLMGYGVFCVFQARYRTVQH
jgi:hypothetical protein